MISVADVERALAAMFIAAPGASLRREDRKKAVEVAAMLDELARIGEGRVVVDVAAGKSCLGLLAVELCGASRLVVIERDPARIDACRDAASRLSRRAPIDLREGDAGDAALWPVEPDVVTALHACGDASDRVIDAAILARARWILLVPCCYAKAVPFARAADERAEALGLPRHAEVRRRFITSLVDAERALRLEAAGWETTIVPFVAPTVTPHNLLFRARRAGEPGRMREAAARLARLRGLEH